MFFGILERKGLIGSALTKKALQNNPENPQKLSYNALKPSINLVLTMENAGTITLSAVLSEVCAPGAVFDLEYRKTDGVHGEKKGCQMTPSNSSLTDRRKLNRSGMLKLMHQGQPFNLYIDLLVKMNGQIIDHLS